MRLQDASELGDSLEPQVLVASFDALHVARRHFGTFGELLLRQPGIGTQLRNPAAHVLLQAICIDGLHRWVVPALRRAEHEPIDTGYDIAVTSRDVGGEVSKMALVSCSECGGKVSDKASSCPHCGAPALGGAPASQSASSGEAPGWYVATPDSQQVGPVTTDQFVRGWLTGRIPAGAKVRAGGDARWFEPTQVPELASAMVAAQGTQGQAAAPPTTRKSSKYVPFAIGGGLILVAVLFGGLLLGSVFSNSWRDELEAKRWEPQFGRQVFSPDNHGIACWDWGHAISWRFNTTWEGHFMNRRVYVFTLEHALFLSASDFGKVEKVSEGVVPSTRDSNDTEKSTWYVLYDCPFPGNVLRVAEPTKSEPRYYLFSYHYACGGEQMGAVNAIAPIDVCRAARPVFEANQLKCDRGKK